MAYSTQDIADYYNQTLIHYKRWWKTSQTLGLHYGIWEKGIKSFPESILNTNVVMAKVAGIKPGSRILDAGCGVGGAAFYLAQSYGCQVEGITLSEKQLDLAKERCQAEQVQDSICFSIQDYSKTSFESSSFDYIWACESVCHAENKAHFVTEANRLLKPGGILIMSDFFLTKEGLSDPARYIKKWADTWGVTEFCNIEAFPTLLSENGFTSQLYDYTSNIKPSSKRLHRAYWLGAIPSIIYNLFHRTSRFAKHHYRSGFYQYKALRLGHWKYMILKATKI